MPKVEEPPIITVEKKAKATEELRVIGVPRRRVDARAKVTGQTKFADDITLPRMAFCKLLRSPHPHARIRSVNTSRAEAHPGVYLVLTGKDLPIEYGIIPVSQDEQALCLDHVRHVGDPVAAVIAREELTALEALDLIDVDYEILTTVSDPEEALATPSPRIHDYGEEGNVHKRVSMQFGDVDASFAESDQVFEDTFFFQGNTHLPIEQHASVAMKDPEGKLTIWSSTQTPHYLHKALAKVLQMPAGHIRVIATPNGGGFGGKSDPFNHEIVVSKAALILDRPVKIGLTREEVFYCHRGRHPVLMKFKTGVKKDGTITAMHLQTLIDGGAYGSYGVASTFYTGALQTTTYHIPRYKFQGCRTFTNKPPCGPKRGHGTVQPRFGQEVQMDKIAEKLNMDPAEFRLKNATKPNSLTANFLDLRTVGLPECIRQVVKVSGWKDKFRKLPEGRGVGLACSCYLTGAGLPIYWNAMPHSGVQLKLDRGGGVTVFCGATEIGQGSDDMLAAIVAEVFGIDTFDIRVYTGDTDLGPVDLGSYSSRVTIMAGNAALQAADRARSLIAEAVAIKLQVPKDQLRFVDHQVYDSDAPERRVSFQEAVCLAETKFGTIGTVGSYTPPKSPALFKGGGVGPSPTYSYSAAVIEVEVNPATGWFTVPKVWIAHDIGRALNPTLVRGQVEGSVYMGLGEALMEEMEYRRLPKKFSHALVHKFPSILEYKSPTSLDMPEVETVLVEEPDPRGPYGAKEVGQGPLLPMMPAVANAVYDAVGVRVDEFPITPEKIMKALAEKKARRAPRYGPDHFPTVDWGETLLVPPPWEGGDGYAINEKSRRAKERQERERLEREGQPIMMRLPLFEFRSPRTIAESARILEGEAGNAMALAGGTDLLPNMKRRQQVPRMLVSLREVAGLREIQLGDSGSRLGACLTLTDIAQDPRFRNGFSALWQAAAQVATPHIRNMATLGGNICLDTRCNYYDQSYEWRKAINFCMKKDGTRCWVALSSPKCMAVSSTDTAPALIALGARVRLVSHSSEREVLLSDLYNNDGMNYMTRRPDEILAEVLVDSLHDWKSTYWKLRRRGSFDFPVLSVAAAAKMAKNGTVEDARIVIGAVASRPLVAADAAKFLIGRQLSNEVIDEAAGLAFRIAKPLDNTDFDMTWRKKVTTEFVKHALHELRGDDMRAERQSVTRHTLI